MPQRLAVIALAATCALGCTGRTAATAPAPAPRLQLFLLAGQSNMAGRGVVEAEDRIVHPRVFTLDRNGQWVPAVEPIHFDKTVAGVGPGRAFGVALAANDPSIRIGLIPAAVGGSPVSAWEPGALYAQTNTHPYDDAIARARVAMASGDLKAILWHQGESDANERAAPLYEERLRALIVRFRTDLGTPDLPVIIGQLGKFDARPWDAPREKIDAVHRSLAASMRNVVYVSAAGLRDKGDTLHFSAASARELGKRYADAYRALVRP